MDSFDSIEEIAGIIKEMGVPNRHNFEQLPQEKQQKIKEFLSNGDVGDFLDFAMTLDAEKDWQTLQKELNPNKPTRTPRNIIRPWLKYAAILAGLTVGALLFYHINQKDATDMIIPEDAITLTLDDGSVQIIDPGNMQGQTEKVVLGNGQIVGAKNSKGLQYDVASDIDELIYNELSVPYGKLFALTLSDGSTVQLNSGTKLRYPVKFLAGREREVFIDGEAYFDVVRDSSHAFVVHAENVAVEVLGTQFNLSNFKEDPHINTVLVEGSVKMYNTGNASEESTLVPGEKGSWNRSDKTLVTDKVDIRLYTDWINGELIFRNAPFQNIVKKLERRYDVSITSNHEILNNKRFNASFHVQEESIEEVLNAINKICPLNYQKMDDSSIIITQKQENR